ncbi:MAG: YaaR family protein [Negativicutes bacterium]|nr:YaaR family protein [Negativicutes bacterium]
MKINKAAVGSAPLPAGREGGSERAEPATSRFDLDLYRFKDGMANSRLKKLLQAIDDAGKRLATVPTYGEMKHYRSLVQQYIGEAVNNMYSLEQNRGWDHRGRQRVHTIVRKIDRELEGLSEDMRQEQDRQLKILARLDTIRGLLVDIYY